MRNILAAFIAFLLIGTLGGCDTIDTMVKGGPRGAVKQLVDKALAYALVKDGKEMVSETVRGKIGDKLTDMIFDRLKQQFGHDFTFLNSIEKSKIEVTESDIADILKAAGHPEIDAKLVKVAIDKFKDDDTQ